MNKRAHMRYSYLDKLSRKKLLWRRNSLDLHESLPKNSIYHLELLEKKE